MTGEFEWTAWLGWVALSIMGGWAIFWAVAGFYHVRYYVLRRDRPQEWKCQPRRFLRPDQQRRAALSSTGNLAIGGLLSGTFIYCLQLGLSSPIYLKVSDYGWSYTLLSTVILFVAIDGMAYYAHRLLHQKTLFRKIHREHHRYVATSPFVTVAMHPVEFVVFQAATFLPLFIVPTWAPAAIVVFVYVLVFNIIDHSGVRLHSRIPWQGASMFHDDHHVHFHCNFGQHLQLWDRVHGTLRRVDRRYGADVFGGKGSALKGEVHADDSSRPPRFVRY